MAKTIGVHAVPVRTTTRNTKATVTKSERQLALEAELRQERALSAEASRLELERSLDGIQVNLTFNAQALSFILKAAESESAKWQMLTSEEFDALKARKVASQAKDKSKFVIDWNERQFAEGQFAGGAVRARAEALRAAGVYSEQEIVAMCWEAYKETQFHVATLTKTYDEMLALAQTTIA